MKKIEDQKSWTPPTTNHSNKKKVFGVGSEILIKYKRIKWTPSIKASHFLPRRNTEIIFRYKLFERREMEPWVCFRTHPTGDIFISHLKINFWLPTNPRV